MVAVAAAAEEAAQADADDSNNVTPEKGRKHGGGRQTTLDRDTAMQVFLETLRATCNVTAACKAAQIARKTAYAWRDADEGFKEDWLAALASATQLLEGEAFRRAVEGTDQPVYQGGELVGTERKYSDTLLIFLLKAANPAKYRERVSVEHGGALTVKVERTSDWRGPKRGNQNSSSSSSGSQGGGE